MPHPRFVRQLAVAFTLVAPLAACRQGAQGFGDTPAGARQAADDFLGAVALRFTDVYRTPRFEVARPKLGRNALTPSRIVDDTTIWTNVDRDGTRVLTLAGYSNGTRYIFNAARDWPLPTRLGQSRHVVRLTPGADGDYGWRTDVDQAVGTMPADAISDVFGGFFRALELLPEATLRAEARGQFPRTTAAFGRLFDVDSLRATPHRDGGKSVQVVIRLHPERIDRTFPEFADYLRKYIGPARYAWTLRDRAGMRWLEATADDDRLSLRFRVHDGSLQPFEGAPRPMPEQLRLDGEMFAKVMIFEVGASGLTADVQRVRTAREDGWKFTFQREPEWHFPLATRHLIRAPLRRPFEGSGSALWLSLRQDNGTTYVSRGFRTVVKESAIVRWLGTLGWAAMSDFAGKSEDEENRFIAEGFTAMRLDSRELLRGATAAGE